LNTLNVLNDHGCLRRGDHVGRVHHVSQAGHIGHASPVGRAGGVGSGGSGNGNSNGSSGGNSNGSGAGEDDIDDKFGEIKPFREKTNLVLQSFKMLVSQLMLLLLLSGMFNLISSWSSSLSYKFLINNLNTMNLVCVDQCSDRLLLLLISLKYLKKLYLSIHYLSCLIYLVCHVCLIRLVCLLHLAHFKMIPKILIINAV
jgi:hypothetical protein